MTKPPVVRRKRVGRGLVARLSGTLPPDIDFDNPETRRALLRVAYDRIEPLTDERIPLDLARAITAVQALRNALRMMGSMMDASLDQVSGLWEAEDLLLALAGGYYHPALAEWEASPKRGDKKWLSLHAVRTRLCLLAIVDELKGRTHPETGRKIGPSKAREQVAGVVRLFPGFEAVDAKALENWLVTLPKQVQSIYGEKAKAIAWLVDWKKQHARAAGLKHLSGKELLDRAQTLAARVTPAAKAILVDAQYVAPGDDHEPGPQNS